MHLFPLAEYLGMSSKGLRKNDLEVLFMCNNNFCGNIWWIIILLILFCHCGGTGLFTTGGCGCGCETNCGGGCC